MGFGVREPASGEHVPGTSLLYDAETDSENHLNQIRLKHAKGKDSGVILVPQPSDSPNDPLNWPQWKKNMTFLSICFSVSMAASTGSLLSPVTGVLAKEFRVSITKAALPGGYPLLTSGIGAYMCQAWAPILGKRSAYILSTLVIFTSVIWSSKATSFGSLLGSRIYNGFGVGAYESIVISSIGDLFFVHERGKRIVLYNIVSLGCATLTPVLGGYISTKYGWRMQFYILTAFSGFALLSIIFACPETTYIRSSVYDTDIRSAEKLTGDKEESIEGATTLGGKPAVTHIENTVVASTVAEKPRTYLGELKPFSGLITRQNPIILLARPFACFLYPAVFWGFTVGGLWSSWTVGLGIVLAQIFSPPPNLFGPTKLGLLFLGPFVFLLAGCLIGVFLADWWPKWCARRNKGVFEPEFRLILLVPVLLVGVPGIFGFGYYASRPDVRWMASSALQGLICFASVLAGSVSFGYVLDCHRDHSVEVSVAIIMLRNFFWFGSVYFLPHWLDHTKTWKVFNIIGSLQMGITLCSILVYMFGKQLRNYFHKHDPLAIFHLI